MALLIRRSDVFIRSAHAGRNPIDSDESQRFDNEYEAEEKIVTDLIALKG
jgi:hypothetical protein